jgi:uncharacterized Zn finger protein
MSDQAERVAVACPGCSPGEATVHEVLSTGGGLFTVRCAECGHVHKEEPPGEETVDRTVVVSQEGESTTATLAMPADETVRVGEEFVVDTDEAILGVRVTAIEVGPEERVEAATPREIETVWTRAVDNVTVDVTLHPEGGGHDETRSVEVPVPGDEEFVVGERETFGEEAFVVEGIVVRGDASGYPRRKLDRRGDAVPAKDVARVYARDELSYAWSAR